MNRKSISFENKKAPAASPAHKGTKIKMLLMISPCIDLDTKGNKKIYFISAIIFRKKPYAPASIRRTVPLIPGITREPAIIKPIIKIYIKFLKFRKKVSDPVSISLFPDKDKKTETANAIKKGIRQRAENPFLLACLKSPGIVPRKSPHNESIVGIS